MARQARAVRRRGRRPRRCCPRRRYRASRRACRGRERRAGAPRRGFDARPPASGDRDLPPRRLSGAARYDPCALARCRIPETSGRCCGPRTLSAPAFVRSRTAAPTRLARRRCARPMGSTFRVPLSDFDVAPGAVALVAARRRARSQSIDLRRHYDVRARRGTGGTSATRCWPLRCAGDDPACARCRVAQRRDRGDDRALRARRPSRSAVPRARSRPCPRRPCKGVRSNQP